MIKIPMPKKNDVVYHHTTDETLNVHASSFLPRPTEINPLAHQAVNKAIEVSKRSNDLLGTKPKKQNTMLMLVIMVIAIAVVAYVIYQKQADDQAAVTAKTAPKGTTGQPPAASNTPPKPSDILPIPLPGLG